jgi:hypothetical protein
VEKRHQDWHDKIKEDVSMVAFNLRANADNIAD